MKRVRWGILGTASIARRMVVPAIQRSEWGTVAGVASRELNRAKDFAAQCGIPAAYGSYGEMVNAEDVDAVYIPLTNDLHLPWILASIAAGKHVLCEKPLALNAGEVRRIQAAADGSGLLVMEGICSHFHPVHERVRELVSQGTIGDVHLVRMSVSSDFSERPNDFRWKKELGGGGLLDLGCYCVRTARMILKAEPRSVAAHATFDPETGVDTNMFVMLMFDGGVTAMIDCGILSTFRNGYEVIGTRGKIVVDTPFGNSTETRKLTVYDTRSNVVIEEWPTAHQINVQMDVVSRCIAEGTAAPVPLAESLQNARVLDACMESALQGGCTVAVR